MYHTTCVNYEVKIYAGAGTGSGLNQIPWFWLQNPGEYPQNLCKFRKMSK